MHEIHSTLTTYELSKQYSVYTKDTTTTRIYIKHNFNNVKQHNKTHTRSRISQTNFFIWFLHASFDFSVGHGLNQTFSNSLKRPDQGSVQLDQSFRTILAKYWVLRAHIIVIPELHLGELDAYIWVDQWTLILNTVHPPCVFVVESMVNLVQLILQGALVGLGFGVPLSKVPSFCVGSYNLQ